MLTISEVTAATGIKPHVLRYWEEHFAALRPLKRAGGRRYYRPADVDLIRRIDALVHGQGFTLKGAEAALRSGDAPPVDMMAELKRIRADLAAALR